MTADELRARQAPVKTRYREDPAAARVVFKATARLDLAEPACDVPSWGGAVVRAGLHPAAAGDGQLACSGDLLLQALAACAGVTLRTVAIAMSIPLRGGHVLVEGDVDFRGTLGVSKDVPVGFSAIRLRFELDTDAPAEQIAKLVSLTERYCIVYQTLRGSPALTVSHGPPG